MGYWENKLYNRLDFSHERELPYSELERRIKAYYPDADLNIFQKAFNFSKKAHKGQKRSSGEEYFIHPCNVVAILIKLRVDMDGLVAGLLHDVIEDCNISSEEISREFSPSVAQIVIGLTKISQINFKTKKESQAENFRKMVVAMAKDIRVILVKLADRMHNMRTLQYINDQKQKKVAQETLDIYVPLASRLGINSVKSELEDLCLRFLHPEVYYRLAEKVAMDKDQRDEYIRETINTINEKLLEYSVKAEIKGRPKHFYSIFKKMNYGGVAFEQIQDMLAFRIIVDNITECYKVLGIIHSHFTPIPGRFKDYIAIPKVNGYQALHTTVIEPRAERIEIQIRTHEMDDIAEVGVAAHWKYKEAISLGGKANLDWIEELLEFNKNAQSNNEFMYAIKNDLDIDGIFIFTPKGDVKELSRGATPLDFAYAIHTDIGHRTIGAKVNGKIVPLKHPLNSGDKVEILTSKNQTPSRDWFNIVKTSKARTKIRHWFLKIEREENTQMGKDIFGKTLKMLKTSIKELKASDAFKKMLAQSFSANEDEFYINIALRKIDLKEIVKKLSCYHESGMEKEQHIKEIEDLSHTILESGKRNPGKESAIIVDGIKNIVVHLARCCNPIPGDDITGYIRKGKGITIHTSDCRRISLGESTRMVAVEWNPHFKSKHPVSVRILAHDRPGILSIISKEINRGGINIRSASAKSTLDQKGSFVFEIEVSNHSELSKTISVVESLKEVISVNRD